MQNKNMGEERRRGEEERRGEERRREEEERGRGGERRGEERRGGLRPQRRVLHLICDLQRLRRTKSQLDSTGYDWTGFYRPCVLSQHICIYILQTHHICPYMCMHILVHTYSFLKRNFKRICSFPVHKHTFKAVYVYNNQTKGVSTYCLFFFF